MNLREIQQLVAQGELKSAMQATIFHSEKLGIAETYNSAIGLSAELEECSKLWSTGQLDFDTYARNLARFNHKLLGLIKQIQDQPDSKTSRYMIRENVFKRRLLWMLLIGKALVIGRLFRHWTTGGFNDEQGWACAGILAPTFAGYLYIVLDDYLKQQKKGIQSQRYVSGPLVRLIYIIIPVYILSLILLIEKKVMPPHLTFSQLTAGFVLVESVLGGYVSRVVSTFFKSEES